MSVQWLLALKTLPDRESLEIEFADLGGVEGDWKRGFTIGGASVSLAYPQDELHERLDKVLTKRRREALANAHMCSIGGTEDALEVGEALVTLAGGAFLSEEFELLDFVSKGRPPEKSTVPRPDVSIPDEVRSNFGAPQVDYSLYPRQKATLRLPAVVKALPTVPDNFDYGSGFSVLRFNSVHLRHYSGHNDVGFWADDYAALGLDQPSELYRTRLEYRKPHVTEWDALLGVVCALARNTQGLLYRPNESGDFVRYDFSST